MTSASWAVAFVAAAATALTLGSFACGEFEGSSDPNTTDSGDDASTGGDAIVGKAIPLINVKVVDAQPVGLVRGSTVDVTIQVERRSPFEGDVIVGVSDLPPDVTASPLTILASATTGTLTLTAGASAAHGISSPILKATGKAGAAAEDSKVELLVRGPAGALDETFGKKGIVEGLGADVFDRLAAQPDKKIVYAARGGGSNQFVVGRLLENGLPDPSFGNQGSARFSFGTGDDYVRALLIQKDGRIVVVGAAAAESKVGILRLTTAGALDTTFGTQGKTIVGSERGLAAKLDANDSIYVLTTAQPAAVKILRLTAGGTLDTSFGAGGTASIPSSAFAGSPGIEPQDLAIGPLGISTAIILERSPYRMGIARIALDGKGAATVGETAGAEVTQYEAAIHVATNGKAVIVYNGRDPGPPSSERVYFLGFEADGKTVDFMIDNVFLEDQAPRVSTMVADSANRFVLATPVYGVASLRVERHGGTGALDPTFGKNGITTTPIGTSAYASSVDLMKDGRIVIGGVRVANGTAGLALARYWP